MASSSCDEKEIFFTRLDELDQLAHESEDNVMSDCAKHGHFSFTTPNQACPVGNREASSSQVEMIYAAGTTRTDRSAPSLKQIMPTKGSNRRSGSGRAQSQTSKRQKSKNFLRLQPEEAQIFRGLTFYFLPNNDIATARRKRIQKAREYGAAWARDWSAEVTHVIVDGGLSMSDVRKAIGADRLQPRHIIVNETYPPDCIKYQVQLPVHFVRFQVALDEIELGSKAAKEGVPKRLSSPTADDLVRSAMSENAKTATLHENEQLDQVLMSHESTPVTAPDKVSGCLANEFSGGQTGDEFDRIVVEMQKIGDLPLDSEDESSEPFSNAASSDASNFAQNEVQAEKPKRSMADSFDEQSNFSCMRKNDGTSQSTNPNLKTIEKLAKMAQYYENTGDHWRSIAYRKCITALKRQSEHIKSREQAMRIAGIGERLANKVEEIACSDRLRRLESTVLEPNDQLLQLFMGIYQVGFPTASRWIAQGHKSLEDLKLKADLTPNQRVGIDHYDDFMARIPRAEVAVHAATVRKACAKVDPDIQLIIGGSYRRGAGDCGDIDLIVTKSNASLEHIRVIMIDMVIPQLFAEGYLQVELAASRSRSHNHGSKWHGGCTVPDSGVCRRIDLLFVPWDELGAALIYFTGNDMFNRSIRLLASKRNMRLNQHGLYRDVMRGPKRRRITEGVLVEGRSEERIFEILGVPWRPPEHRIC